MKTIQFIANVIKDDLRKGTPSQESYSVGQVVTLADDQARRWLRRHKAVEVPAPAPSSAPAAEVQAAPASSAPPTTEEAQTSDEAVTSEPPEESTEPAAARVRRGKQRGE